MSDMRHPRHTMSPLTHTLHATLCCGVQSVTKEGTARPRCPCYGSWWNLDPAHNTQSTHTHLKLSDRGAMGDRMEQGTLGATMGPPADME